MNLKRAGYKKLVCSVVTDYNFYCDAKLHFVVVMDKLWPDLQKGTLSTHLSYQQTKCYKIWVLTVIKLFFMSNVYVPKYCSFMYRKCQTTVYSDFKVMKFQSAKMGQILCVPFRKSGHNSCVELICLLINCAC